MSAVRFFGQYLVERGVVTQAALDDAVDYQKSVNLPLGALALSKGYLSERQVLLVHTQQRRTDQQFGEIAVQRGFITRAQLDELLREQAELRILIGEALVQKGHLARPALEQALKEYHAEQSQAEAENRRAIHSLPDPELGQLAADLTGRLLLRMARMTSKLAGVSAGRPEPEAWWFAMSVQGDRVFSLCISCDGPALLAVVRGMLSAAPEVRPPEEVDALAIDTGKEFLNVVVGHVCSRLSKSGLHEMPEPATARQVAREPLPHAEGSWQAVRLLSPQGALTVAMQLTDEE